MCYVYRFSRNWRSIFENGLVVPQTVWQCFWKEFKPFWMFGVFYKYPPPQLAFTCSKPSIETLEKVWNVFKVNNVVPVFSLLTLNILHVFLIVDFEQVNISLAFIQIFNPFQANFPFLYPLKTPENLAVYDAFRGYRMMRWSEMGSYFPQKLKRRNWATEQPQIRQICRFQIVT